MNELARDIVKAKVMVIKKYANGDNFKEMNESIPPSLKMIESDLKAASKSLVLAGTADQLRVEKLAAIGIRPTSAEDCPGSTDREDLRWVQRSLNKIMETALEADGSYGSNTRTAVRAFQERYGLDVDGKAGSQTKAKIRQLLCE